MIKAYHAKYIKYDHEENKRKGHYLVLEMSIKRLPNIQLLIFNEGGLVSTHHLESVTTIAGYHRYTCLEAPHLGAGDLKALSTHHPKGMLEGLSLQMNWDYQTLATAFGEGLLKLN